MSSLTHGRVQFLLDYDPVTGALNWKNPTSERVAEGGQAGTVASNGRRYVNIDNKRYLAHRLVWFYVHGKWPAVNLSAKNNNYDDLRLENYVELTAGQTARQGGVRPAGKSGIRGVCWDKQKKKWMAHITKDYKSITLGRFDTKEEARLAREHAEKTLGVGPSISSDERARLAERTMKSARLRVEWRKIIKSTNGVLGWKDFEAFAADIGSAPRGRMILVPINAEKTIGPNNWVWVEAAKWDFQTSEGRKAYQKQHRHHHRNSYRDKALRKSFGLTYADYERMKTEQNGLCAVCKKAETAMRGDKLLALSVDHCHATGAVRGLLCKSCNNGLGHFLDDPSLMEAAAAYARHHASKAKTSTTSVPASNIIPLKAKERKA